MDGMGKWLIVGGVVLILLGIAAQAGVLSWLGRLPGDIRIERPGFSFYFPLTTMIVVSALLSLVIQILRRLL
jgi:membrane protein implicated in regulation of membrane protease activity